MLGNRHIKCRVNALGCLPPCQINIITTRLQFGIGDVKTMLILTNLLADTSLIILSISKYMYDVTMSVLYFFGHFYIFNICTYNVLPFLSDGIQIVG